jgi:putative ABC transport system permease protein
VKFLRLVLVNLLRSKRRTFLTIFSIAVALFLFSTLRTVLTSLDASLRATDASRLVVRHEASLAFPLPLAYRNRLAAVPGVTGVSWANWFGGVYQEPKNFFAQFALDAPTFFAMYPEYEVPPDQMRAFQSDRTGCVVGVKLARKYGWRIGDAIPLQGTIYPERDVWRFTLRGIYRARTPDADESSFLFHWDYLNESVWEPRRNEVGIYYLKLDSPDLAARVSRDVDAMFKSSSYPTRTETERAFTAGFISMLGNVRLLLLLIGSAIVFAIMLVTVNTMMMAFRERTTEVAILKTLGFSRTLILNLVAGEAMVVSFLGGVVGCGIAVLVFQVVDFNFEGMFPTFRVGVGTVAWGLVLAAGMGFLSGIVPAFQAARLEIAGALRKVV